MVCFSDGTETIICENDEEKRVVKDYFTDGCRDIDEFEVTRGLVIEINSKNTVWKSI